MVVKQIRVNVSLSKNYNKVECEAIIDIDENDNIDLVAETMRNELIDYCKKGVDAIEPASAPDKEKRNEEELASSKQQMALIRAGYPGDPTKCSKSDAWVYLNQHKLPF